MRNLTRWIKNLPVVTRFALFAALFFTAASCQKSAKLSPQEPDPQVLARVGEKELRAGEFENLVKTREAASPVAVDAEALLEEWVAKQVLAQSARRAGLENEPQVQEALTSALIGILKERQLSPAMEAATVSEDELKAAYSAEKDRFTTPERARLAILFLATPAPEGAEAAEAREKLQAAIALARTQPESAKRSFGALSINHSDDQESRYRGGELGWVERDRYPQRIESVAIDAGFGLSEPGQVGELVQGKHGIYAVMLLERQAPAIRALEDVAPILRANLLQRKREEIESKFLADLRASLRVEVHSERLPARRRASPAVPSLPSNLP